MNPFLTEAFAESLLDQSLTGVTERGGWLGSFVAKRLVTVTASSLLEMPGPYADALARLKATRGGEGPEPRDTDEGRAQGYSWVDRGGVMPTATRGSGDGCMPTAPAPCGARGFAAWWRWPRPTCIGSTCRPWGSST